jgi:hypothetical protein
MKTISKFVIGLFIAGSLVLGLTAPADAQRAGRPAGFERTAFHLRPDAVSVHLNGFYHPYVYPHVGGVVRELPLGYYSFVWNTYPYYYADGMFYQSYGDGNYKIAAPPVGAEVPALPIGADIITIDGYPYFQYNGVYYESVIRPGGEFAYKVVGRDGILNTDKETDPALPLVGDMTDRLPEGARQVKLSGKSYWVTPDDIYLEEAKKDEKTSYRVVWVPERKKEEPSPAIVSKN